jgi:hypothetical protein
MAIFSVVIDYIAGRNAADRIVGADLNKLAIPVVSGLCSQLFLLRKPGFMAVPVVLAGPMGEHQEIAGEVPHERD